jgi:hypothetical protein
MKTNTTLHQFKRETSYEVIKTKLSTLVAFAKLIPERDMPMDARTNLQDLILERISTIQDELNFLQTDELKKQ